MIDKLILKNFQAHKSSELDFCPGCNCIIGESDEGKTSIIRALYWASQNKPSGGDFISDFSKRGECSASIVVGDNGIERVLEFHTNKKQEKVIDRNAYWANDLEFKALGKGGIPDEVKNILQLDDLNFQNQMDAPFLLSKNGGDLAKYLNQVADLNIITTSLTKAKSKVDTANGDVKRKEAEIEVSKTELIDYVWIKEAESDVNTLEDDYSKFQNIEQDHDVLKELLNDTDDLIEDLEPYKDLDETENQIISLIFDALTYGSGNDVFNGLKEQLNDIDDLAESIAKFKDNDDELYQISLLMKEWESWDAGLKQLDSFKCDLNSVKTISDQIGSLAYNEKEIESLVDLTSSIGVYLDNKKSLTDFQYAWKDVLDLKEEKEVCIESIQSLTNEFERDFPPVCPLCSQEIKK